MFKAQYSWKSLFNKMYVVVSGLIAMLGTVSFSSNNPDANLFMLEAVFAIHFISNLIGYNLLKLVALVVLLPISIIVDKKLDSDWEDSLEYKWLNRLGNN